MSPWRFLLILTCIAVYRPLARAADAPPRGPYAQQLQRECDELLALAVRRPYGWAWADGKPDPKARGGGQAVILDPPGTPGAAFVLYWCGDLLDVAAYKEAAYQAVRGIAAAQRPTGQVPARPMFLPASAGARDEATLVADRGPTRAALGLTLTVLEESGGNDDLLRRCAQRGITWMLKQQAPLGGWPIGYPPATAPKDAARVTRLDQTDFRDSTFSLLLAADVLQDNVCRAAADRSIATLLRMRIGGISRIGEPLWAPVYGLDGFVSDRVAGYPPGIDPLASRHAMQTLLGAYLVLGNPRLIGEDDLRVPYDQALREAASAAAKLPTYEGLWIRNYYYDVEATPPPPHGAPELFNADPSARDRGPTTFPSQQLGTWGMHSVLRTVAAMNGNEREVFAGRLAAHLPIHQRLAAALCGVEDQPFSVDWPTNPAQATKFLTEFDGTFKSLEGLPPQALHDRVRRLWLLWLRARMEIKFGR